MRRFSLLTATGLASLVVCCAGPAAPSFAADQQAAVVAPKYKVGKAYLVITKDGKVFTGSLTRQDDTFITLTQPGGQAAKIPHKNIEQIREAVRKGAGGVGRPAVAAKPKVKQAKKKASNAAPAVKQIRVIQRGLPAGNTVNVREKVDPKDPSELVLVLSPKGPVIVRLDIYVDGKPYRAAREAIVDELMEYADSNEDEKYTWEELLNNPRGSFGRYRTFSTNKAYRDLYIKRNDVNGDGLVDRYELRRYVASLGYGAAFNVRPSYAYQRQPDVKKLLDADKDGKLSKEELAAAGKRLKSRDANDNDLLEATELGGGRAAYSRYAQGTRLSTRARDVFQLGPTAELTSIYSALQKRYGNDSKEIKAAAFAIDPKLFKKLDLNKNGVIESGEMVALHLARPALHLEVRLGTKDKVGIGVVVKSAPKGVAANPADAKGPVRELALTLPGWKLRIEVPEVQTYSYNYARYATSYLQRYDVDKNQYIDKKDIEKLGNQARYVESQFKNWDANGDGKVYAKEIEQSYMRMYAPQQSQVSLTESSQGPSLFAALDVSGDNRLSLREMRTAGQRLQSLDRNKNGRIDADEMPTETVIALTQGRNYYRRTGTRPVSGNARGPKWFIHMDKNGDGDVTLKEFLGTREQFHKLDTNKDGFIEPKEAEAAAKQ